MYYDLADYISDNYGECTNANGCSCLKEGIWLGKSCPCWSPVKPLTWDQVIKFYKEKQNDKR